MLLLWVPHQAAGTGAGLARPLQIPVPDQEHRHDAHKLDAMLQGIGCLQVFLLFAPQ